MEKSSFVNSLTDSLIGCVLTEQREVDEWNYSTEIGVGVLM